jgi:hypothetical protein
MVSLLSALGCLLAAPVPAPQPTIIVTDTQWKGVEGREDNWHSVNFDDSAWKPALVVTGPASIANVFLVPTKARWIWGSRSEQCFLRRTFDAPRGFRRAEMLFATDEMGMVFVNGRLATEYHTAYSLWGKQGCARLFDLGPYLVEGKNVIGVELGNIARKGQRGFAAEIRINGEPFVPPPERPQPAPGDLQKAWGDLVKKLDADEFAEREEATKQLIALVEKHRGVLRGAVDALFEHDSVEVHRRAEEIARALEKYLPRPGGNADTPALDLERLVQHLHEADGRALIAPRILIPARAVATRHHKALADQLRSMIEHGTETQVDRAVAFAVLFEMTDLADALAYVVQKRPGMGSGIAAASALGRLGAKQHRKVLEDASRCDSLPMQQAARYGLRLLGE